MPYKSKTIKEKQFDILGQSFAHCFKTHALSKDIFEKIKITIDPIYKNKTSAKQMLFSLRDDAGEQIYQTFLPVPSVSGVVAISMPEEAPELTVNKKYKWTVAIICGKSLRPDSPTIEGWIQRVPESSSLTSKLQSANPLEKIALYGENGLWYDLVSSLNKLRIASPSDQYLSKAWEELIKDNGIKSIERTSLAN